MSFPDPLSPFNDPHRDVPPWPTTPHNQLPKETSPLPRTPTAEPPGSATGFNTGPWGKEPQIYGQPEPGLISPQTAKSSNGTHFEKPEPYLRVRITALDRNRRDILIRFDAQTNLTNFTGGTYRNVTRSYAEFSRFYEQIIYSNPQTIIPALPLPQTSAPTDDEDDRLVKVMLQRWFSRICEDPILLADEELRSFIESDFGYQPMPRQRRKAGGGFSLLGRRPPDEDEELARARFELTRLETQYIETAKAIDKLARSRKMMSVVHGEMGNKLIDFAATEVHPPLGSATRKMGRTWHSYSDLDQAQAISDCVILGDTVAYQGMNARSAKETLLQRTAVLEEYQDAVKTTIAKRRNIERLKASSNIRPERVDDALEEMEEAHKVEQHLHRRVEGISQNLHRALGRHSRLAHEDLTAALIEHARTNILYERQLLKELESLLPDVRAAADAALPVQVPPPMVTQPVINPNQPPMLTTGAFLPNRVPGVSPHLPASSIPSSPVTSTVSQTPTGYVPASPTLPHAQAQVQPPPQAPQPVAPPLGTSSSLASFPRTNQFAPAPQPAQQQVQTPVQQPVMPPAAPSPRAASSGFPRTSQFVTPSLRGSSSYNVLPRTSQFISGPMANAKSNGQLTQANSSPALGSSRPQTPVTPSAVPLPASPQPSAIPQARVGSPQISVHPHPHAQYPQQSPGVDPLAGVGIQRPSLHTSVPALPSQLARANVIQPSPLSHSVAAPTFDPLTGSVHVHGGGVPESPLTPGAQVAGYNYNGQYTTVGPVPPHAQAQMYQQQQQGTIRGLPAGTNVGHFRSATNTPQPTRSRLDAREAASKLANFL